MTAILGVLLEENDSDVRPPAPEYSVPGEYTEMEISRVSIFSLVILMMCSVFGVILTFSVGYGSGLLAPAISDLSSG